MGGRWSGVLSFALTKSRDLARVGLIEVRDEAMCGRSLVSPY